MTLLFYAVCRTECFFESDYQHVNWKILRDNAEFLQRCGLRISLKKKVVRYLDKKGEIDYYLGTL